MNGWRPGPPVDLRLYTCRVEAEEWLPSHEVGQSGQHAACHVLDFSARSALGVPFAMNRAKHATVLKAYDDLISLVVWLGVRGDVKATLDLPHLVARRHAVKLRAEAAQFKADAAWRHILEAATSGVPLRFVGLTRHAGVEASDGRSVADVVAGAVAWTRHCLEQPTHIGQRAVARAGNWALSSIYACWPREIATELASFAWPLTNTSEVDALLAQRHAAPTAVVAFL